MKGTGELPKRLSSLPGEVPPHSVFGRDEIRNTTFFKPWRRPLMHTVKLFHQRYKNKISL